MYEHIRRVPVEDECTENRINPQLRAPEALCPASVPYHIVWRDALRASVSVPVAAAAFPEHAVFDTEDLNWIPSSCLIELARHGESRRRMGTTSKPRWKLLRAWFVLTPQECLFLAGIAGILLLGLVARYVHLKQEGPEPAPPPNALVEPAR